MERTLGINKQAMDALQSEIEACIADKLATLREGVSLSKDQERLVSALIGLVYVEGRTSGIVIAQGVMNTAFDADKKVTDDPFTIENEGR